MRDGERCLGIRVRGKREGGHSVGARDAHELEDYFPRSDVACAFTAAAAPPLGRIEGERRIPGGGVISCAYATTSLHRFASQPHVPVRKVEIR
jgi:hypothetical protein